MIRTTRRTASGLVVVGSQEPNILHLPESDPKLGSAGQEVVELAQMAGLELDPWQAGFIAEACTYRKETFYNPYTDRIEHKWAARDVGLMISRQNGKGSILEARELAGLFLFGERLITHSAHQFDTSVEAFERIMFLIENTPDFDKEVDTVSRSHGTEGITLRRKEVFRADGTKELRPAQRLKFRTRTKGGGRGFTGDCLVLDEAMILEAIQIRALMPTLSARPNPQLWYTGSAGDRASTEFGRIRSRALNDRDETDDPELLYAEWSAQLCDMFCDPDCTEHDDPADPITWAKANASMNIAEDHGLRTETIRADYRAMDLDSFAAEHLGIGDWPVDGSGWLLIPKKAWNSRSDKTSEIVGKFCLGVDVAAESAWGTIVAAGANRHGDTHVEVTSNELEDKFDHRPGSQWIVDRVVEIWDRQRKDIECVVIDMSGPAGELVPELIARGVKVVNPTPREFALACNDFHHAVMPKRGEVATLTHIGQDILTSAVRVCDKKTVADLWAFSKINSSADISPLYAATLAKHGYKQFVFGKKAAAPWAFRM